MNEKEQQKPPNGFCVATLVAKDDPSAGEWEKLFNLIETGQEAEAEQLIKQLASTRENIEIELEGCNSLVAHAAAHSEFLLRLLLEEFQCNPNLRAAGKRHQTPLFAARGETPALLLAYGADEKALDDGGESALTFAIEKEEYEQAAELLQGGVFPWNAKNAKGQSCVHRAAAAAAAAAAGSKQQLFWDAFFEGSCAADPEAAKNLLNTPDYQGKKCIKYAEDAGRGDLVQQFIKWGAENPSEQETEETEEPKDTKETEETEQAKETEQIEETEKTEETEETKETEETEQAKETEQAEETKETEQAKETEHTEETNAEGAQQRVLSSSLSPKPTQDADAEKQSNFDSQSTEGLPDKTFTAAENSAAAVSTPQEGNGPAAADRSPAVSDGAEPAAADRSPAVSDGVPGAAEANGGLAAGASFASGVAENATNSAEEKSSESCEKDDAACSPKELQNKENTQDAAGLGVPSDLHFPRKATEKFDAFENPQEGDNKDKAAEKQNALLEAAGEGDEGDGLETTTRHSLAGTATACTTQRDTSSSSAYTSTRGEESEKAVSLARDLKELQDTANELDMEIQAAKEKLANAEEANNKVVTRVASYLSVQTHEDTRKAQNNLFPNSFNQQENPKHSQVTREAYENALLHSARLQTQVAAMQKDLEKILKKKTDEENLHAAKVEECRRAFREFVLEVARNSRLRKGGKPLGECQVQKLLKTEEEKLKSINALRREIIAIECQQQKQQGQRTESQHLKEEQQHKPLQAMDFDQLKRENQTLNERLVERQDEEQKLQAIARTSVQLLTHWKAKLAFQEKKNAEAAAQLGALDVELAKQKEVVAQLKKERGDFRQQNKRIKSQTDVINSELLTADWEATQDKLREAEAEITVLQQKYRYLTTFVANAVRKRDKKTTKLSSEASKLLMRHFKKRYINAEETINATSTQHLVRLVTTNEPAVDTLQFHTPRIED